jgi:hypothetical protein
MSQTNLNVESFCMRPSPPPQNATCTAHRRDGLRCKGAPIRGATVCRLHGGSATQVRDAARKRILAAADPVAARLIEIALNVGTETQHAITAITQVLNRAGVVGPVGPVATNEGTGGQVLWEEFVEIHRRRCKPSSDDGSDSYS